MSDAVASMDARLLRLRIVVLAAGFVIVGAGAGGIFDELQPTLVAAPLLPTLAALVLVRMRLLVRLIGATVAVLLTVIVTVAVTGGSPGDVASAFGSGIQGLLSTDWPSPARPDLVATMAAVLSISCAVGTELATRRRLHLSALVPLVLAGLVVVGLSAPLGVRWPWTVGLIAVSTLFALLRSDGSLADRLLLLRGERRLVPLIAFAVVLVVVAMLPVGLDARADPRRNDPAEQTAPLLDPIEATLALRALDPARDLHVATADVALPARWRTAALTSYDGRRWSPSLTLRPIGSTLGVATGPTISADVSFLDDNLTLVPLTGSPVSVGAPVETDALRTVVRLAERPVPGDAIGVVANTSPTLSSIDAVGVTPRLVDESVSGLTELAEGLAGTGDPVDQLRQLEATMRNDFVLDSDVQGGGLERALIDRFLRDTQRGTREQFATSFALLARALGIESRVATGFVADAAPGGVRDELVLTSSDAEVWPEVQLGDGTWLPLDPTPPEEASDSAPPPPEPQVQSPAAPQPPIAPPPESDNEPTTTDDDEATADDDALSTAVALIVRGSIALAVLVLPFALAAALILGVKYRRRRRRLGAPDAVDRVRGAWASATDALVDAGLPIGRADTDAEIAADGAVLAPDASMELRRLATMSSAATFGRPRHPDRLAEDAASYLDAVERGLAAPRTRWQRVRWRLSLRSLRTVTRSPVTT